MLIVLQKRSPPSPCPHNSAWQIDRCVISHSAPLNTLSPAEGPPKKSQIHISITSCNLPEASDGVSDIRLFSKLSLIIKNNYFKQKCAAVCVPWRDLPRSRSAGASAASSRALQPRALTIDRSAARPTLAAWCPGSKVKAAAQRWSGGGKKTKRKRYTE